MELAQQYISDEEVIESAEISKSVRGKSKSWNLIKTFDGKLEATNYVSTLKMWSYDYKNATENGSKIYYRCNIVKSHTKKCPASIHLLLDSTSNKVQMYETEDDHNHEDKTLSKRIDIEENVKAEIVKMFEDGKKPKFIRQKLGKDGMAVPSQIKLNNFLSSLKKKKFGNSSMSLGELEAWLASISEIPSNIDEPYAVNYLTTYEEEGKFQFFISTRRLLYQAAECCNIHADTTYKCIWQGYPVIIVGTSDANRKFHYFGIIVSMSEKTEDFVFVFESLKKGTCAIDADSIINPDILIADAAPAIQNAFKQVFGAEKMVVMCWVHMRRNVDKKLGMLIDEKNQKLILDDIYSLQIMKDKSTFDNAVCHFFKKWEDEPKFLDYFKSEWISKNSNWYEGYRNFTPSTNNCLESCNKVIKDQYTLRERLPINRFKIVAVEMVETWSLEYKNGLKTFDLLPTIPLSVWTSAYQWVKLKKEVIVKKESHLTFFFIPSGENSKLNDDAILNYSKIDFNNFDELVDTQQSLWVLEVDENDWVSITCTCPFFFKNYYCKHSIGMSIRHTKLKPPPEAKNVALGQKRKRGRPAKAKKALLVQ